MRNPCATSASVTRSTVQSRSSPSPPPPHRPQQRLFVKRRQRTAQLTHHMVCALALARRSTITARRHTPSLRLLQRRRRGVNCSLTTSMSGIDNGFPTAHQQSPPAQSPPQPQPTNTRSGLITLSRTPGYNPASLLQSIHPLPTPITRVVRRTSRRHRRAQHAERSRQNHNQQGDPVACTHAVHAFSLPAKVAHPVSHATP